jgi:hypothetical protein
VTANRAVEVDAIAGSQSMPERHGQTRGVQTGGRHKPDLGPSEGILDHLLLDQDESSTRGALRGYIGVTLPVHLIKPIRNAGRHALLKPPRCTAKTSAAQPRLCRPKRRERSRHGAVDDI